MDDLIGWLRAQLDEDERVAREAHAGPWFAERSTKSVYAAESSVVRMTGAMPDWDSYVVPPQEEGHEGINPADAEHIARWDPARVLAEIDAKRQIIDWAEAAQREFDRAGLSGRDSTPMMFVEWLALPFADREGYRDEWRP